MERLQGPTADVPAEVTLLVDEDGPWKEVAVSEPAAPSAGSAGRDDAIPPEVVASQAAVRAAAPPILPAPPTPRLAAPARRATPPPPPRGTLPTKSPAELARERYLSNPTRIQAQRITFRCPARFAGELRRTADAVVEERPGAVTLSGHARVTCRELTLEADRILLEVLPPGAEDLHVTAKGNASFVTVQREQVLRHEGVRSLLVTNDRVLPLP